MRRELTPPKYVFTPSLGCCIPLTDLFVLDFALHFLDLIDHLPLLLQRPACLIGSAGWVMENVPYRTLSQGHGVGQIPLKLPSTDYN